MTAPPVLPCWLRPDRPPGASSVYRLAGRLLAVDAPLAALAPLAVAASAPLAAAPAPLAGAGRLVCRSSGWLGNAWRKVQVWRHDQGLRLQIAGIADFAVLTADPAIVRLRAAASSADVLTEALLGPPLTLALGFQGVWCLHASAVRVDGRVIAFAGESGHGKSTLAAYLDGAEAGAWRRVADDILPVALEPDGVLALPHFPQLKLPAAGQYPVNAPPRLPLAAVYVIAPTTGQDSVSLRVLGQREAMQALIRHTVAARLFDRSLLAAHLAFCAGAAARIPVWRLAYPHRHERLPQVRAAIGRSLVQAAGGGGPCKCRFLGGSEKNIKEA